MDNINYEPKDMEEWESLGISNDFLFGKIMRNPQLCQELLQRILPDLRIQHIEYPELQKAIRPDMDAKSIRLDVYVQDGENVVYDIEMQMSGTTNLPKRTRYYQSIIDLQLLDKGREYRELNRSYIIFICLSDVFGEGRHIYTFENRCKENTELLLGDEAVKIFLNADSTMDDVSDGLRAFLDYVAGKQSDDDYIQKLEEAVKEARKNREWRHEYMTLLLRDRENYERGEVEGRKKEKRQNAEKALRRGLDLDTIMDITGLTEEEIHEIQENMLVLHDN